MSDEASKIPTNDAVPCCAGAGIKLAGISQMVVLDVRNSSAYVLLS